MSKRLDHGMTTHRQNGDYCRGYGSLMKILKCMHDGSGASLRTCPDEYVKSISPAEKQATDITRKTNGDRLIQMRTHHGTLCPGERLNDVNGSIG